MTLNKRRKGLECICKHNNCKSLLRFIDYEKAFDSIEYDILLDKLINYHNKAGVNDKGRRALEAGSSDKDTHRDIGKWIGLEILKGADKEVAYRRICTIHTQRVF